MNFLFLIGDKSDDVNKERLGWQRCGVCATCVHIDPRFNSGISCENVFFWYCAAAQDKRVTEHQKMFSRDRITQYVSSSLFVIWVPTFNMEIPWTNRVHRPCPPSPEMNEWTTSTTFAMQMRSSPFQSWCSSRVCSEQVIIGSRSMLKPLKNWKGQKVLRRILLKFWYCVIAATTSIVRNIRKTHSWNLLTLSLLIIPTYGWFDDAVGMKSKKVKTAKALDRPLLWARRPTRLDLIKWRIHSPFGPFPLSQDFFFGHGKVRGKVTQF